jgi:hypothetical protein
MTIRTSWLTLLEALRSRWVSPSTYQHVVICLKRENLAIAVSAEDELAVLVGRLQQVAQAHPQVSYDGLEFSGAQVKLYFFSGAAQPLARDLALALGEAGWGRGAVVRVCSDIGLHLEEYTVSTRMLRQQKPGAQPSARHAPDWP